MLLQGLAALGAVPGRFALAAGTGMIERAIPGTGEKLPVIGMGTWQTFDVRGDAEDRAAARTVLDAFRRGGGRVVDTSPMYGSAEEMLGTLADELSARRALFLATKVWTSGRADGVAQMQRSMRLLRAERVDLIQVHNLLDVDTHLETLRTWKGEGRVRFIGVTHYTASAHDALARQIERGGIDFVQVNYSIAEPEAATSLLPLAAGKGVAILVNRPFAEGALFRRVGNNPLPDFAAGLGCTSWAQLFLKWIVAHPAVTAVLPATRNPQHLADNLASGIGQLPDDAMRKRIAEAV
jgi:diketogulonate reductase-like aldo/keto reductase